MVMALIGGLIIGFAASMMLIFNGRVTGVSGIVSGLLSFRPQHLGIRAYFILGLLSGGVILKWFHPEAFHSQSLNMNLADYALAGVLVGLGTLLGNGCTSGHGVCGLSRLSLRSLVATITFISFGVIAVLLFKFLRGDI